ncbi:MucR family transcriptional regulator [Phenylobacterium sp.]|uniref:MucR family transcriptional regulator n=1 Tax=Phenylobacterium sp. TaxID=1871053 RepID=UPI0027242C7A|nr:MucR family transcriptional regulator [Phenylobacterium sp.]MDO8802378.1 MucR family transcriptional regulator [Phenylobacterium sp.]
MILPLWRLDAEPYKMFTRHLACPSLIPAAYRAKWGLPFDYPMTAPGLSAIRTAVAKSMGLGRWGAAGGAVSLRSTCLR